MQFNRRRFMSSAAAGALALAAPSVASAAIPRASCLNPLPPGDRRVDALRRLRSSRLAERAFGLADWSSVAAGPLDLGGSVESAEVYYVPMRAGRALLILSHPEPQSAWSVALRAAAARSGDRTLLSDDIVVELVEADGVPTLRWSTVDGRELASRQVAGEQRLLIGRAGGELTRALGHPAFAFALSFGPHVDVEAQTRRARQLLLYRAAASGKATVRRAGMPLEQLAAAA